MEEEKNVKFMQSEYGTNGYFSFLSPSQVKMYDSENKEIQIPICDKCKNHKSPLIGKQSFTWCCTICR